MCLRAARPAAAAGIAAASDPLFSYSFLKQSLIDAWIDSAEGLAPAVSKWIFGSASSSADREAASAIVSI